MSADNLHGTLLPDGTVEFEHGVEKHPDFMQLAEDVFGEMTADPALMREEWWTWIKAGMPGLRDRIEDRGPCGDEVATFLQFSMEQVERALGRHMRSVFLERVGEEADRHAGWLLSNPKHLEQRRQERAEREWEERTGANGGAA